MSVSIKKDGISPQESHTAINKTEMIGLCPNCGRRLTLCGKPFSAVIPCGKCLYINEFRESQQPVSGHW